MIAWSNADDASHLVLEVITVVNLWALSLKALSAYVCVWTFFVLQKLCDQFSLLFHNTFPIC